MDNTEQNLYNFYRFIGKANCVNYIHEDGYHVVFSDNLNWPQTIFDLDKSVKQESLITKISKDILNKKYPTTFITHKDFINKSHSIILKEHNILPILKWVGMSKKILQTIPLEIPKNTIIRMLNQPRDFEDFSNLVNEDLMVSLPFNKDIWNSLASNKEINIYGLYYQNTLASTIVVYYSNGVAGLYFLATQKSFRNNGFGVFMMQYLLNEVYLNGVNEAILHTNGNAKKLHEKVGFSAISEFIIYKKF